MKDSMNRAGLKPVYVVKPPRERRGSVQDVRAWLAKPSTETEAAALDLLRRCGPLVVDGVQYRAGSNGRIESVTRERLDLERLRGHVAVSDDEAAARRKAASSE